MGPSNQSREQMSKLEDPSSLNSVDPLRYFGAATEVGLSK